MTEQEERNGLTWRALNREGCELGRATKRDLERVVVKVNCLETKIDRLTWALVGAAITFGTAAIMLALNLVL
jgi:hypothetical protein